jgi:hypothetical protein
MISISEAIANKGADQFNAIQSESDIALTKEGSNATYRHFTTETKTTTRVASDDTMIPLPWQLTECENQALTSQNQTCNGVSFPSQSNCYRDYHQRAQAVMYDLLQTCDDAQVNSMAWSNLWDHQFHGGLYRPLHC